MLLLISSNIKKYVLRILGGVIIQSDLVNPEPVNPDIRHPNKKRREQICNPYIAHLNIVRPEIRRPYSGQKIRKVYPENFYKY